MSLDNLIVFTHIPKTSGTSFQKSLVETNINDDQIYIYKDLKRFIQEHNRYKFVVGHVPYGLHYFTNKKVKCITFLRYPIERAVSFYFFIKDSDTRFYKHPLRDYVDSVTLKEFYENKKFQSQQTKFISGFINDRLYPSVPYPGGNKLILNTAIAHF